MSKNILVAIIHPDEWNQFIPFSGYLQGIKNNYDYVIGVVPEAPLILLEADEYYTVKNEDLKGLRYPGVLDTPNRVNHNFINKCVERVIRDFKNDKLTFISWQATKYHRGVLPTVNVDIYKKTFKCAQDWYKTKKLIYPTEEAYNRVKAKYGHLFDNNSFVVVSRNFKKKALVENTATLIVNFDKMMEFLTDNKMKIINVGFPPAHCSIDNGNYHEINDPMSQDELVGLFYLAKGVMLPASSAGWLAHFASNVDVFALTAQWGPDDMISHKSSEVSTGQLHQYLKLIQVLDREDNFQAVFDTLSNHKTTRKLKFADKKKITYVSM